MSSSYYAHLGVLPGTESRMRNHVNNVRDGKVDPINMTRSPWTASIVISKMMACATKEVWIYDHHLDRYIYGDEVFAAATDFLSRSSDAVIKVVVRDFEESGYPLDRFLALGRCYPGQVEVFGISTKAWESTKGAERYYVGDDGSFWVVDHISVPESGLYMFRTANQKLASGLRYKAYVHSTMPG